MFIQRIGFRHVDVGVLRFAVDNGFDDLPLVVVAFDFICFDNLLIESLLRRPAEKTNDDGILRITYPT